MNATGVVGFISNKKGFYSIKIEDGEWYGFGKVEPSCSKGDEVSFDFTKNARGYFDAAPDTLEVLGSTKKTAKQGYKKASKASSGDRDGYWERKEEKDVLVQNEIRIQASRNAAIAFTELALRADAIKFPANATPAKKFDVLMAAVEGTTAQFYETTVAINADPAMKADVESDNNEEDDNWDE